MSDATGRRDGPGAGLVGRDAELDVIRSFLSTVEVDGGALLLLGEPGLGKTTLLDSAAEMATAAGMRVLRAAGVQFEADVSFAGLHQALLPLLDRLDGLAPPHRAALSVAMGSGEGPSPQRPVVVEATLALLRQVARADPVVVILDDLQWVDRVSASVLGSVARRAEGTRVGFLAAVRPDAGGFFELGGLPGYELEPLAEEAAADLMARRFPGLEERVRHRVLSEAQGNPLALLELPTALSRHRHPAVSALPAFLPLSRRLQTLFGSRVADLPARPREALLLAALDGTGDLGILRVAVRAHVGDDELSEVNRSRLLLVDEEAGRVSFRHPLIRSAVVELSSDEERRRAHRTLADTLTGHPDRQAWHLAQATVEPDEEVAASLEQVAHRVLRRGDGAGAVTALTRSADLSPIPADRARRLAEAAFVGADLRGESGNASRWLLDARQADPDAGNSLHAASAAAFLLTIGESDVDTAHRVLVGAIETGSHHYDARDPALIAALHTLVLLSWHGGRPELWRPLHAALDRLTPGVPEILAVQSRTAADPTRVDACVLATLDALIAGLAEESDPVTIARVGMAAISPDRLSGCRDALWRVVRVGREGGFSRRYAGSLSMMCFDYFAAGEWDQVDELAEEGLEVCTGPEAEFFEWCFLYSRAMLAAARGDADMARKLAVEVTRAAPRGVRTAQMFAEQVRLLAALGSGDIEDAYAHATAVSPAGTLPSHVPNALWVAMDLVESAVRTGRHDAATAHAAALQDAGLAAISPRLAMLTAASAAVVADGDGATALFEQALAVPGSGRWPFEKARVALLYGENRRRARATVEAQALLTSAANTFERLGAQPWAARANRELRASGYGVRQADIGGSTLTSQERAIADLAASGLSNKQIAERLYLSHRTVGAHLYRIYPKLGISSRAALRDALDAANDSPED
ncbi:AAA family ATPase [Pseudonocardia xinjiangensis]|uniref:AAA family ATPase n=1 Tax=Pseudonocardia xinjiangensis TaxID=75289 RepID=A0ABX1RNX6_9PSEU|nr:LuxR family transcriptional regulator [Pseudonocardia xinjiangensis]NMH80795.1 AAA family ATPase [Pseudonocardia xinjiangensis]